MFTFIANQYRRLQGSFCGRLKRSFADQSLPTTVKLNKYQLLQNQNTPKANDASSAEEQRFGSGVLKFIQDGQQAIEQKLQNFGDEMKIKSIEAQHWLEKEINSVENIFKSNKIKMKEWMEKKFDSQLVEATVNVKKKIKKELLDENQPRCIRNFIEEIIENMWANITEMLRLELKIAFNDVKVPIQQIPKPNIIFKPWHLLRNYILYTLLPWDMSIWQCMRLPSWWILTILKYVPLYGIQFFFYFFLFICIDKSDTYQLVSFILTYKNTQFITAGCINAILGYFSYFFCADLLPNIHYRQDLQAQENEQSKALYHHSQTKLRSDFISNANCINNGPGSSIYVPLDLGGFILQFLLIWIAFFLTKYSRSKTQDIQNVFIQIQFFIRTLKENLLFLWKRSNFYNKIIKHDFKHFQSMTQWHLSSLQLLDYFYFKGRQAYWKNCFDRYYSFGLDVNYYNPQQLAGLMYFIKLIYGMLSFPFQIFIFTFFITLFTNSQPTGYDKMGNCLPKLKKILIEYDQNLQKDNQFNVDEILDIMSQHKDNIILSQKIE